MIKVSKSAPGYCPSCNKTVSDLSAASLCPRCGDRYLPQGYCPVCEAFQPREPGALCAKHDVELLSEPPAGPPLDEIQGPWVEVAGGLDPTRWEPMRIRLEAEGIPTLIEDGRMGSRSMYQVATGGATLKVPESLAADARVILSQTWSRDAAELGIEPDDDWDDLEDSDGLGGADSRSRSGRGGWYALVVLELLACAAYVLYEIRVWFR
ncbi:hypothetical protein [Paludisphaera rhizosphaerae]|uniref:hypothetical protein n=1 Tax=Paludisphaera rhizosphaerae TaxID=2711216 RepID=UPI0013EB5C54|nr:hypothetical protein [Paludisphaera rhizosphaerae]